MSNATRIEKKMRFVIRRVHALYRDIKHLPTGLKISKKYTHLVKKSFDENIRVIWYFCIPLHNNLGDYAQYLSIKKWAKEYFPDYSLMEIPSDAIIYDNQGLFKFLKSRIKDNDLIIFQSGYTSNDCHPDEFVHRKITRCFNITPTVFFPQTVNYLNEKKAASTFRCYQRHKCLLFFARDQVSYNIASQYLDKAQLRLAPDVVTTLIGERKYKYSKSGIYFCIRHDGEKLFSDEKIKKVFSSIESANDEWSDTTMQKDEKCSPEILNAHIEQFAKHKVTVTDRFHGTILSLIASTPVVVLSTNDHKVSEGAKWFDRVCPNYIKVARSLSEAVEYAKNYLELDLSSIESTYLNDTYYKSLKTTIEELYEGDQDNVI